MTCQVSRRGEAHPGGAELRQPQAMSSRPEIFSGRNVALYCPFELGIWNFGDGYGAEAGEIDSDQNFIFDTACDGAKRDAI